MSRDSMAYSKRRQVLKTLGAGVGVVGLAGCTGGDGGDGSSGDGGDGGSGDGGNGGDGSSGDDLTEVTVSVPHYGAWDTSLWLLGGEEAGVFEDAGLSISKVDVSGGGENIRVTSAGDADVGIGTGMFALFAAYREGTGITVVGNSMNRMDALWYTTADSPYDTLEDATDARIGFSRPGSSTHIAVLRAIEHAGLSDAEDVSVGGPPDSNASLEGGDTDIAWTVAPSFFDSLETYGGSDYKTVFSGGDIPPLDEMTIRAAFARNDWLSNDEETARAFFGAYIDAWEWVYNNLDRSAELWGELADNDDTEFLRSVVEDTYPREVLALEEVIGVDQANEFAVQHDFIDDQLSEDELNEVIDTSYLS